MFRSGNLQKFADWIESFLMLAPKCSVPCVSCLAIYSYEISVNDIISQTPLKLDNTFKVIGTWDRERQRLHKPCFHIAYQAIIGWHPT